MERVRPEERPVGVARLASSRQRLIALTEEPRSAFDRRVSVGRPTQPPLTTSPTGIPEFRVSASVCDPRAGAVGCVDDAEPVSLRVLEDHIVGPWRPLLPFHAGRTRPDEPPDLSRLILGMEIYSAWRSR